ncbi:uncharacterized protein LOC112019990 [Quercus suber]
MKQATYTHTFKPFKEKIDMAMYFNTNIFLLAFFAITVILSSSNNVVGQGCLGDVQGLISQCASYVKKGGPKIKPSPQCCDVIKKADIPCVCKQLTAEIEKAIDMEKMVFVAKTCGKPLAPGSKCGAFNVPPAAYIG